MSESNGRTIWKERAVYRLNLEHIPGPLWRKWRWTFEQREPNGTWRVKGNGKAMTRNRALVNARHLDYRIEPPVAEEIVIASEYHREVRDPLEPSVPARLMDSIQP